MVNEESLPTPLKKVPALASGATGYAAVDQNSPKELIILGKWDFY